MEIPIVYEDRELMVLNKPAGVKVHNDGKGKEETASDWLVGRYPELKNVGDSVIVREGKNVLRQGIVHRLDKETSGVLLIAKTQQTLRFFKRQFKERKVEKTYHCFAHGVLEPPEGSIDLAIGRSHKDFRKRSTLYKARGVKREAITEYRTIERGGGFSFVEVRPKTGRTHQIRVHLKSLGCSVVCDPLYSPKSEIKKIKNNGCCPLNFERLALHASSLSFTSPSGTSMVVEADLPPDFNEALKLMKEDGENS